jgi:hypothetical protein
MDTSVGSGGGLSAILGGGDDTKMGMGLGGSDDPSTGGTRVCVTAKANRCGGGMGIAVTRRVISI